MDINESALSSMIQGIIKAISLKIKYAKFNKGVTGIVTEKNDSNNYIVIINNKCYKAKSRLDLQVGNVVKIICWNNDMSELYIIY